VQNRSVEKQHITIKIQYELHNNACVIAFYDYKLYRYDNRQSLQFQVKKTVT